MLFGLSGHAGLSRPRRQPVVRCRYRNRTRDQGVRILPVRRCLTPPPAVARRDAPATVPPPVSFWGTRMRVLGGFSQFVIYGLHGLLIDMRSASVLAVSAMHRPASAAKPGHPAGESGGIPARSASAAAACAGGPWAAWASRSRLAATSAVLAGGNCQARIFRGWSGGFAHRRTRVARTAFRRGGCR